MQKEYFAHSLKDRPLKEWQRLDDHLRNVANIAGKFAESFKSHDWAFNAAWIHDLGKADSIFQGYLCRSNDLDDSDYDKGRINHSSAGAALAEENFEGFIGCILAYLIAGHHAGLPDWHSADTGNAALSIRLKEGKKNLVRIREYADEILKTIRSISRPPCFVKPDNFHIWVRMLYSCLVDADFLDTETYMNLEQSQQRSKFLSLNELKTLFDLYMKKFTGSPASKTNINKIRNEILSSCRTVASENSGIFSLTVPTGGGKTLSSMAFALEHAIKYGKYRIIYVIPYTSIIEQIAEIFGKIFGSENIVEHHSNFDSDKETQRMRLATENWDAPIIVTTNVQFFESLYSAKSSRCRKLHNIINSVIIFDESQLLPPELLVPCVKIINELSSNYGVTIILSTATQPALPELNQIREIIPPEFNLYNRLKRTEIYFPDDLNYPSTWAEIAEQLKKHEQVLCIVNTRKDCHELYSIMPEDTIHLSALMCGKHRSEKILEIKNRLKAGIPIRVISTQLVEAGVDIDFPVVYRAIGGLDSISQAAGRCNREGKASCGKVIVFIPPKSAPPGILLKGENKTRELAVMPEFKPDNPDMFTRYFKTFYSSINDTGYVKLHEQLIKDVPNIQFRSYSANFKIIDDRARSSVIVRYKDSGRLIERLRYTGPNREIMRKLQRYTINLSDWMVKKMKCDGLIEEIYEGIFVQALPKLYNNKIGFDIYRETLPAEDLIL
ncbi:MAG: CRISPR-associated helicase Cas3' [Armatimonadetes bacterium]|nr:CRISPR-associated helicase Cas3' [Armatimonadota bacterium]